MKSIPELISKLLTMQVGEAIEVSGIEFRKTALGVEIDCNEIPQDEIAGHIDLLFHYEHEDTKDE